MLEPGRHAGIAAAAVLLAGLLSASAALADDLTTVSGRTYHDVQPLRVEPDGIIWRHAEGIAKVDFADSPEKVRAAYHYDPARAAAYRETRARAQREAAEQARQLVQTQDERLRARAQTQARAAAADAKPQTTTGPTLVYRHGLADTVQAAARSLGEQMDAHKAQVAADANNSEGLGAPRLWSLVPGQGSAPKPQHVDLPNSMEFTHPPSSILLPTYGTSSGDVAGAFGANSADDPLFKPIYMTRSYNEDVDRAAAFARGTPLK